MVEVVGNVVKWLQLIANMVLVGTGFFFIVAYDRATLRDHLLDRLERALPWLAIALVVLLVVTLAIKAAEITGSEESAWRPSVWVGIVRNTWLGKVWCARAILAILLVPLAFYARITPRASWRYMLLVVVASAALGLEAFSSHAAADETPALAIAPYAIHLVLAGLWFGGLPAFLAVVYGAVRSRGTNSDERLRAMSRFSAAALPVMLAIIATGLIVASDQIGTRFAALVASQYGWLLLAKLTLLCGILAIAAYARFVWLPSLARVNQSGSAGWQPLRKGVIAEFALACLLLLAATLLASSIPAKHAVIDNWPYPFRFSIRASSEFPETTGNLVIAGALCAIAVGLAFFLARYRLSWRKTALSACLILALSGVGLSLYSIAIKASVDSYRDSTVPFDAISIARGKSLFEANCTSCHGLQGRGDGKLAKTLPVQPIDLLTEQHAARHLAGDFYNWIGTGFPDSGMPGFGWLSADDRWDLVNFLHVISRGYESRPLTAHVVPNRPSANLGAPNFSFKDQDGEVRTLKDYRDEEKAVLLVFFAWSGSRDRLDALRSQYAALADNDAEIIAIPWKESAPEETWAKQMPFSVIQDGREISASYEAFRRSISHPDLFGPGEIPDHMELLVDRFGYLRARWIPEQDGAGWSNGDLLMEQLDQLRREEQILPPAEDHVH